MYAIRSYYESEVSSEIYQAIIDEKITSFRVEGMMTAESAWSVVEKNFESEI